MDNQRYGVKMWRQVKESMVTLGGDPVWECPDCGQGRHVYGIEMNEPLSNCPNCGVELRYF